MTDIVIRLGRDGVKHARVYKDALERVPEAVRASNVARRVVTDRIDRVNAIEREVLLCDSRDKVEGIPVTRRTLRFSTQASECTPTPSHARIR